METARIAGLNQVERAMYLGIAKGRIVYRPGKDQEPIEYASVEGRIVEIRRRDAQINGQPMKFYDFIIKNGDNTFNLSVPMGGGVAKSIVNSLMSIQDFRGKTINIRPYTKVVGDKTFTNVNITANGEKAGWFNDHLPAVKTVTLGSKEVKDDSEQVAIIEGYVDAVNARLAQAANAVPEDTSGYVAYDEEDISRTAPDPMDDLPAGDDFMAGTARM